MKKIFVTIFLLFTTSSFANQFGFNVGFGLPYLTQFGLNYVHSSKLFSAELGYHNFDVSIDDVGAGLTKTELALRWHPFEGSFYIGAALGTQTMYATSEADISGETVDAEIKVTSNTLTPHLGWMWGKDDGGFYIGMEFGLQNPSGADSEFTTNADGAIQATQEYQDLVDDTEEIAEQFGETSFLTMTLFRVGYLF